MEHAHPRMRKLTRLAPAAVAAVSLILLGTAATTSAAVAPRAAASPFSTLQGVVKSPNGEPVADATVLIYPIDSNSTNPGRIGTVTTNSQGNWSFTLPASLPTDSQAEASANGGWLNVIATAFGSDGASEEAEADGTTFAWAGQGNPANTATLVRPPMTMIMGPALAGEPPVTGAVIARTASRLPKKCRTDDSNWRVKLVTVWNKHEWTDVGEYHAWWEADGGFTYTRGAMTEVSTDYSINGSVWHASLGGSSGTVYDNEDASSDGTGNGPYKANVIQVSLKYRDKDRYLYPCSLNNQTCWPSVHCANHYWIVQRGLYNPGHGWQYIQTGPSVLKLDGMHGWHCCANPDYWNGYRPGYQHCNSHGDGVTYTKGATIGLGPVTVDIETETGHSTDSEQCISFSHSTKTRYNEIRKYRTDEHEVWGNDALPSNNPEVFYNY